jgi:hypothetical protein
MWCLHVLGLRDPEKTGVTSVPTQYKHHAKKKKIPYPCKRMIGTIVFLLDAGYFNLAVYKTPKLCTFFLGICGRI